MCNQGTQKKINFATKKQGEETLLFIKKTRRNHYDKKNVYVFIYRFICYSYIYKNRCYRKQSYVIMITIIKKRQQNLQIAMKKNHINADSHTISHTHKKTTHVREYC